MLVMAVTLIQACAPTTQTPSISNELAQKEAQLQRELAVKENMKDTQRLEDVAAPILMANTELCGNMITPYLGAEFATKDAFSKDYQEAMESLYGVGQYPTITMIGAKTPAAGALKIGDMATHINGQNLPEGKKSLKEFEGAIKNTPQGQTLSLTVDRQGASKNITVKPALACDSPVRLVPQDAVNAFADGEVIGVTKGMMRFVEFRLTLK